MMENLEPRIDRDVYMSDYPSHSETPYVGDVIHGVRKYFCFDNSLFGVMPYVHGKCDGFVVLLHKEAKRKHLSLYRSSVFLFQLLFGDKIDAHNIPENKVLFSKNQWKELCSK